jgi:hypothetical protein
MLREDNNGFVTFPIEGKYFNRSEGKTFVYLIAFDSEDFLNKGYELSNVNLNVRGNFVSDDLSMRSRKDFEDSLHDTERYFPNIFTRNDRDFVSSIPLTACICIGWDISTYDVREEDVPWCATFRDLSGEGRRLYYSIKKLHNTKEVRILTFNNI